MLDILLIVVLILSACGVYIYRSRMKQRLIAELTASYNEGASLIRSCTSDKLPIELKKTLHHPLGELSAAMRSLEASFSSELAIFRAKQIIKEEKPLVENKCKEIRDICTHWNKYAKFKQQVNEVLYEINARTNEINDKIMAVARYDKDYQEVMQFRAAGVLSQLEEYQQKCKEMNTVSFSTYNEEYQALSLPPEFIKEADLLSQELHYFNRHLKVLITGLFRKSVYYINLEDSSEKSSRRTVGTVQVSYKTFREAKKGDSYKWEIVIGAKYTSGEQNITFKFINGDQQTSNVQKLSKSQFEEIYKVLKFNRKYEESDENGIPYQINAVDLSILVCEKKAYEFDVAYELDLFKSTSIYDYLSYDNTSLALSTEADSLPEEESEVMPESDQPPQSIQ
jgi:hypothetical protein